MSSAEIAGVLANSQTCSSRPESERRDGSPCGAVQPELQGPAAGHRNRTRCLATGRGQPQAKASTYRPDKAGLRPRTVKAASMRSPGRTSSTTTDAVSVPSSTWDSRLSSRRSICTAGLESRDVAVSSRITRR